MVAKDWREEKADIFKARRPFPSELNGEYSSALLAGH
jgi:hypothetical protein